MRKTARLYSCHCNGITSILQLNTHSPQRGAEGSIWDYNVFKLSFLDEILVQERCSFLYDLSYKTAPWVPICRESYAV